MDNNSANIVDNPQVNSDIYITSSPRSAKPSEGKRSVGDCAVVWSDTN